MKNKRRRTGARRTKKTGEGFYSLTKVPDISSLPTDMRLEIEKSFTPNPKLKTQLNNLLLRKAIVQYCKQRQYDISQYPTNVLAKRYKFREIPRDVREHFEKGVVTHNSVTKHPLSTTFRENAIAVKVSSYVNKLKNKERLPTRVPENVEALLRGMAFNE